MAEITIPLEVLDKNKLTINEYLILYNLVNSHSISTIFDYSPEQLKKLENKGYIKLTPNKIYIREKTNKVFSVEEDLFLKWLKIYPVRVKKTRSIGSRALSPQDPDTILGRKLKAKWSLVFRKNIKAQEQAIQVLELQLKDMERSGDLEFMVEATRWLNEGYHEKYSYLLDENQTGEDYVNEDYM